MRKIFYQDRTAFITLVTFVILSLSFLSCGSTRNSIAIEEGWELLGEVKAGFIRETDVINVTSRNQFTSIRFKVEGQDVKLSDLSVYFDSGDRLSPALDQEIPSGHESREIELAADGRTINRVEFKYRTIGNILKGKANILVFGKRYRVGF
jgi:hypothetical protein